MPRRITALSSALVAALLGVTVSVNAYGSALPKLSIANVTVSEASCSSQVATFTVTVSAPFGKNGTAQFATADGTAIAGTDYTAVSGTLSFARGSKSPQTFAVPITDVLIPGANKTFYVNLTNPQNATLTNSQATATIVPPTVAKCQSCGISCDDGNSCTHDYCSATLGCKHVDVNTCSLPVPGAPSGSLETQASCNVANGGCTTSDVDGDGLSDSWETAGGYDFNCDGTITPDEMVLTNVDPVFPDGTPNPHPSADPNVKDVFVKYDWMELADQLTNGQPTACTLNTLASPYTILLPHHSDACSFDQACLPPQGSTAACNSVVDGCSCKGHTDEPSPAGLKMVIDAYAAQGIRLHLVKGVALAHANVTYPGVAPAACTQEFSGQTFSGAQVVNFYDIKTANFNASYNGQTFDEQHLYPVFHYVLFAHRHTCDSVNDCNNVFCSSYQPVFNSTGFAEIPGNDIIISEGGQFDRTGTYYPDIGQGGTFMHELGHNLGLNHGGPVSVAGVATDPSQNILNYKPNFITVMNYDFQIQGISSADPACAPDDTLCRTTGVATRLDYSSFCPLSQPSCDNSLKTVPNTLDETNGSEAAGINIGNNDISYTWSPAQTAIPATGPVDFNGDGNTTDTWCTSGCTFTSLELNFDPFGAGGSGTDTLLPFEDWPNLSFQFQCSLGYVDGTAGASGSGSATQSPREISTDEVLEKHLLYSHKPVRIQLLPTTPDKVSLAVFGAPDFDVSEIEISSLRLHGAKPASTSIEDINHDGRADLVVSFRLSEVKLGPGATRIHLSGWLKNSQVFFGEEKLVRSPVVDWLKERPLWPR
jgi:hypothetical protein